MDIRKYMFHGMGAAIIGEWLGIVEPRVVTMNQAELMEFAELGYLFSLMIIVAVVVDILDMIIERRKRHA